ncbi:MAG: bifunctional serine/threonine-protein kinase/formylglycine-generating enzyme family protein, partial [Planctomycetota bacterium]|nr:bifunctional serine/threonine-protein kinase/formylglycine-generating enzyme family protein [Planctomycetota bacterium]
MNKSLLEDANALKRFQREIDAVAQLNHPNIVTAYHAPQFDGLLGFAMEYVEGTDLEKLVQRHGIVPVANACHYIHQAAAGLQHASERNVFHRDIKPSNLMLAHKLNQPLVKILDFGLAKAASESYSDPNLTGTSTIGTPHYMAPEQIADSADVDSRADIYSLGCTLYFLLTGHEPFAHLKKPLAIIYAHANQVPPFVRQSRSEIPEDLERIVTRMMAKSPNDRFQSPGEVARELAPFFAAGIQPLPENGRSFGKAAVRDAATSLVDVRHQKEVEPVGDLARNSVPVDGSRPVLFREGTSAGDRLVVPWKGVEFPFRWCPPTSKPFRMGSPLDEVGRDSDVGPVNVTLSHGFWMLETPVTRGMWDFLTGRDVSGVRGNADESRFPASNLTWNAAKEFCQKLTDEFRRSMVMSTGWILDLPTEAQWEYACRAGSTTRYCFGDDEKRLGDYAWYAANSNEKLHPVGLKKPNAWQLCDMHGLVWEWTNDWYAEQLQGGVDPNGAAAGSDRVFRGGSAWRGAADCRS